MYLREFPYCCTAQILVEFGESMVAEGGNFETPIDVMRDQLTKQIDFYVNNDYAFIAATTNSEQKTVNKVLDEFGFEHTPWMYKDQHPETKVRLWWLNLAKYFGEFDRLKVQHKKFRK